jgi:hypothetical protein
MDARTTIAAAEVTVVVVCTAVAFGAEALIGPEAQATQGMVTHVGPIGMKGSTSFMLAGSGERYDCHTNNARECSMIKEGDKISIRYDLYKSGARSVESLTFLDEDTTSTPTP